MAADHTGLVYQNFSHILVPFYIFD